jgi:hypothetical protein
MQLASSKAFVDAFCRIAAHPRLNEHFFFKSDKFTQTHGQAMHYLNQYLRVYGVHSDPALPFHRLVVSNHAAYRPGLAYLERLILQVAVLGLVLKVFY